MNAVDVREAITRAHRAEWARVVAALTRRFGDLDIAEEAAAEAFASAVERWPVDGVPPNPGGWLTTTANRRAIDRIRRESKRDDKQREAQLMYDDDPPEPLGAIDDERLRHQRPHRPPPYRVPRRRRNDGLGLVERAEAQVEVIQRWVDHRHGRDAHPERPTEYGVGGPVGPRTCRDDE